MFGPKGVGLVYSTTEVGEVVCSVPERGDMVCSAPERGEVLCSALERGDEYVLPQRVGR